MAYHRWQLQELWGVTEAELDWRELVAMTRPAPSPQKTIKNPLREAAGEAGPSKKVVKRKRAAGEGRVVQLQSSCLWHEPVRPLGVCPQKLSRRECFGVL